MNNTLSIKVITSFNQQYYDMIGHLCVETWADYWPLQCELDCYVEGFDYESSDPRINSIPFSCLPPEYKEFQASDLGGRVKIFAKKAYSIIHALENATTDRLIWLDADTVTTNMIPMSFLESLCPNDTLATFMGVWHNMDRDDPTSELKFSGETGVFVVNTQHPGFEVFAKRYAEYYNQRLCHNLRRFYDGEVFGAVVQELKNQYKFRDLSSELKKAYNSPLKHTELGKYLIHYKSKHSKQDFVDQRQ